MKRFLLVVIAAFFGGHLNASEELMPALDPFLMYRNAIQDTRLISIDVSLWNIHEDGTEESQDVMEKDLEIMIGAQFEKRGLDADIDESLEQQPKYEQFQDFYDAQRAQAASFLVAIYRKEYAVFVNMWCLKNYDDYSLPIYACSFSVNNDQNWWSHLQNQLLMHVEKFLDGFSSIQSGPYGWVPLEGL